MLGFKPRISGVRSNRHANFATTTATSYQLLYRCILPLSSTRPSPNTLLIFWGKILNIEPFILFKRASFSSFPSFLHHANDRFKDKLKGDIGIPTADIWFLKGPLCQLRHNHCHFLPSSETIVFLLFFFHQSLFQKSFILALFVQVFHVFR